MDSIKILVEQPDQYRYIATASDEIGQVAVGTGMTRQEAVKDAKQKSRERLGTTVLTFEIDDLGN